METGVRVSDQAKIIAQRIVEHVGSVDGLIGFFFEAAETERKLPAAYRSRVRAAWPDVLPDPMLAYGWHDVEVGLPPATNGEVTRYDWAIAITGMMAEDDMRLVWAAAHSQVFRDRGPRWSKLGKLMHLNRETVKRRFERGILTLWFRLVDLTAEKD